jgi:predicted DNA-binding protein YlxM (UPF0122 family)
MRSKQIKFTVADIAKAKGISRDRVYKDIKKAKFQPFKIRSFAAYILQNRRNRRSVDIDLVGSSKDRTSEQIITNYDLR